LPNGLNRARIMCVTARVAPNVVANAKAIRGPGQFLGPFEVDARGYSDVVERHLRRRHSGAIETTA
jgi:hypothetical protein